MVGESNGGMLVYRYLCHHADELAGAVSMFGTDVAGCQPNAPIPVMHVHGMADSVVPYDGGWSWWSALLDGGSFPSVPDTVTRVARSEGCASPPTDSVRDEIIKLRDWSGCRNGSRVRLVSIVGMSHHWPGAPFPGATEILRFFGLRS
jgi:polyhydroxybutyrate depolymerase